MAVNKALLLAAVGVLLAGCGWLSEDDKYYMRKDWEQLKGFNWRGTAEDVTGFKDAFPSPTQREAAEEKKVCLHKNGGNRVVSQNGVSDEVTYRHCVLAPYPTGAAAGGERIGSRADGV